MKKALLCVSLFLALSAFAQGPIYTSGDNVGIGTNDPQDRLHVFGSGYQRIRITSTNNTTQLVQYPGAYGAYWDNAGVGLSTYFRTSNSSIMDTTALTLSANGNAYFAHDVEAGGQIKAKFQDIAEWVPSNEPITAGSVVVVGARNHVMPSTDAYDTRVAGVVSPQPGIVLGDAGASKVLVATSGRVKVRVDTSNGPIQEGDLLVSSATKGVAMKSEPLVLDGRKFHQPGTVVGKALEPLTEGTGEILVLLSMQ